jgi:hypothetical protein
LLVAESRPHLTRARLLLIPKGPRELVIETEVEIHIPNGVPEPGDSTGDGKVLDGSSIGGADFCPDGRFRDLHGDPEVGLVDRTFSCPDGDLRIGFTPGAPEGRTQSGSWKVISGSGTFDGMEGDGQMEVEYEPGTKSTAGHETFTGTVVP